MQEQTQFDENLRYSRTTFVNENGGKYVLYVQKSRASYNGKAKSESEKPESREWSGVGWNVRN